MAISPSSARIVVASCAAALALGLAACGDDDATENDADAAGTATSESRPVTEKPATDEAQIEALIMRVTKALEDGSGDVVCAGLTETGKRDMLAYGSALKMPGSCADVAEGISKQSRGAEQPDFRVVKVRVRGANATALIRIDGAGELRQRYRKVGDEWKILSFGLGPAVNGSGT